MAFQEFKKTCLDSKSPVISAASDFEIYQMWLFEIEEKVDDGDTLSPEESAAWEAKPEDWQQSDCEQLGGFTNED